MADEPEYDGDFYGREPTETEKEMAKKAEDQWRQEQEQDTTEEYGVDAEFEERKTDDSQITCHVHNRENRHIGTGTGMNESIALRHAVRDAGTDIEQAGSFGCSTDPDEAHERAILANSTQQGQDIMEATLP